MTATSVEPNVTSSGFVYDTTWVDGDGVTHYRRYQALGRCCGPAAWSDRYDVNLVCGHHLATRCNGCHTCLDCYSP